MPGIDGIEASRRIKQHPRLSHIPTIIMVTAHGREIIMEQAEQTKIDGFLIKPVTASMLTDAIVGVLGQDQDKQDLDEESQELCTQHIEQLLNAHVLLVDDNAINRQVGMEFLIQAGLVVTQASNGKEAVEFVGKIQFDAVLMDIHMPVMDGYEATQIIRDIPGQESLPIIAMTANAMVGDKEKCLVAGMNDHVAKPIDPEQLFSTLTQWIAPAEREQTNTVMPAVETTAPVSINTLLPEELPGIDMKVAMRGTGGNEKLLKQVLTHFLHDHADDVHKIRQAIKDDDMELAQRITHTLKGVAGTIGAEELRPATIAMDAALRSRASNSYWRLLDRMENTLALIIHGLGRLEKHQTDSSTAEPAAVDETTLQQLIEQLEKMIKNWNPDAEELGIKLHRMLGATPQQERSNKLLDHLANFDFENAQTTLHQLKQEL
jgi:CheY-like chemotaxis protein